LILIVKNLDIDELTASFSTLQGIEAQLNSEEE